MSTVVAHRLHQPLARILIGAGALVAAGCGPLGNTLGLEGSYLGELVYTVAGTLSITDAGNTVEVAAESTTTKDARMVIEPGYESDAILSGVSECPVALSVDADILTLEGDADCVSEEAGEFTANGQSGTTSKTTTWSLGSLIVERDGDQEIAVSGDGTFRQDETEASGKRTEGDFEMTLEFSGVRVGGS
ncbi:MAG: hypothetical protein A2138_22980 [Deltaproteobacteria bacterium RBG_16_71_12]|nr:MAG: hypothetical protein A2138_22980 [Deltaproteobacteria bacterium RBG_16_71_12]